MDSFQDAVSGRSITVVYDAPQLPVARGVSRWSRSRQVRRHARRNGATHLLRVVDPQGIGETETWWAGTAGVSLAAAVDEWALKNQGIGSDVVVIPFDGRIYAAELDGGLVENELVLGNGLWREQMGQWTRGGKIVRAFEGGKMGDVLRTVVAVEPAAFDLRGHRYRRKGLALTAAGMYAPSQGVAAGAAATVAIALAGYSQWQESRAAGRVAAERDEAARAAALLAAFTGADVINGAAEIGWDEAMLLLHRDGLGEMVYEGGFEVSFSGTAAPGFPAAATRYAEAMGGQLQVEGSNWRVRRAVGWPAAEQKTVEGFGSRSLAERLHGAAEAARAEIMSARVLRGDLADERTFTLRIPNATANDLVQLAAAMEGRPYRVAGLRCSFEGYLASVCEIEIWAKGVVRR